MGLKGVQNEVMVRVCKCFEKISKVLSNLCLNFMCIKYDLINEAKLFSFSKGRKIFVMV